MYSDMKHDDMIEHVSNVEMRIMPILTRINSDVIYNVSEP